MSILSPSKLPFFEQIQREIGEYTLVEDAEEEICELYGVYYSKSAETRPNMVDATKSELDVELQNGKTRISLSIAQNPNINSELGQTGAVVWDSGLVMSQFFVDQQASGRWDLSQVNAVELGSGCGLVGLVLHRLGARRVVLTDQPRMMKLLQKNVDQCTRQSATPHAKSKSKAGAPGVVYATEYLWGHPPTDLRVLQEDVDAIVVSDCVFNENVASLLAATLVDACRRARDDASTSHPVVVVIGQELRSDIVHQEFVAQLLENFVLYRVPVAAHADGYHTLYVAWLKQ
ncbi:hypothetical protein FBU59_002500 [Linderina macrospora]|uniref:Uncharacterized protein n=1 Tax=Linderina macrospora TaxID=4868 RepID=A0ACC1JB83_9FUNG|nr:hypothetical protein FBU59_002500 [Linderina macrospora]